MLSPQLGQNQKVCPLSLSTSCLFHAYHAQILYGTLTKYSNQELMFSIAVTVHQIEVFWLFWASFHIILILQAAQAAAPSAAEEQLCVYSAAKQAHSLLMKNSVQKKNASVI